MFLQGARIFFKLLAFPNDKVLKWQEISLLNPSVSHENHLLVEIDNGMFTQNYYYLYLFISCVMNNKLNIIIHSRSDQIVTRKS